ncbi:heparan-alpha-glucosaminide N-acetyltransferase domain-containing protein [Confluentibacter sediminis]|uniref:heparan-alpha-glucosaminide N-acetyltransferase domain-containing protein n=1 Tax=Confluentibacter sediminis TaxID=2219045 RepID=UPI000DACFD98|nr:heparan-alpha-glucosaminide N-acetyltransferase domain-containing protein [Confluentibacter sediminis]
MHSNRLYFIDAVRAFAILMMLQGHFIDTLLDPIYRDDTNIFYNIWSYFRGVTAPTFFTISGLVFMYLLLKAKEKGNDKVRIRKGLYRGLLLLFIGYTLRVDFFDWFQGKFYPYFLVVDVLQCIGLSLILMVALYYVFKANTYVLSIVLVIIGCTIFITEPLYRNIVLPDTPLVFANYISKKNGSVFTIIPWFGYSALGAFFATVFFRHVHRKAFKALTICTFFTFGYLLIFQSSGFLHKIGDVTGLTLFHAAANYNYLFSRLGDVLVLFGLFYTFEHFLKQSIITRIGEKTLSIYTFHFIIIFGSYTGIGLKHFYYKALDPYQAIFGALAFILVVVVISFYYAKTNAFLYNLFLKIVDRFKS